MENEKEKLPKDDPKGNPAMKKHGKGHNKPGRGSRQDANIGHPDLPPNDLWLTFVPGTQSSGSVPATEKSGLPVTAPRKFEMEETDNPQTSDITLPVVAKVGFYPVLGALGEDAVKDVLNSTYYGYFSWIRSHNMSLASYTDKDLMKAFYALANLLMLSSVIKKRLRIMMTASNPVSGAISKGLARAYGINAQETAKLGDYISDYNSAMVNASEFKLPKAFRLAGRYLALTGVIYKDDPLIDKSQLISFDPEFFYALDTSAISPYVGQLIQRNIKDNSIANLIGMLRETISAYSSDQDMQNIFAEIRRALDPQDVYSFELYDYEPITITYELTLLDQLKNATIVGDMHEEWRIRESGDYLDYSTKLSFLDIGGTPASSHSTPELSHRYISENEMLYSHSDQPTSEEILNLCAFKASFPTDPERNGNGFEIASCGTELISRITLVYARDRNYISEFNGGVKTTDLSDMDDAAATLDNLQAYFTFSCLPPLYVLFEQDSGENRYLRNVFFEGDVDNRFALPLSTLSLIHRNQLISLIKPVDK